MNLGSIATLYISLDQVEPLDEPLFRYSDNGH